MPVTPRKPSTVSGRTPISAGRRLAGGDANGRSKRLAALLAACLFWPAAAGAQTSMIAGAPPGFVEAGTPSFVVLGPEALGMSAAPVDLQKMPDGRLLAFGLGELALGDGVRWELFRQVADDPWPNVTTVAVDPSGRIYAGVPGGFGRVEFDQFGQWRYARVASLPSDLVGTAGTMNTVSMVGAEWYWSWGSGPIVAWRPGSVARTVGELNAPARIFTLGDAVHVSDASNGVLYRMEKDGLRRVPWIHDRYVDQVITSAVTLADGATLLGTASVGLLRYEGGALRPVVSAGPLAGAHRINDLCDVGHRLLAVALDNVGILFTDQSGRIVQSLDRSVDSRLARVRRLLVTPGGVVWGLLDRGVVRINFPGRFSSFEPMVSTGLVFSQPFRFEGRLWLMSDGRAQRGIYDEADRLVRFEVDTPGPYLDSMIDLGGEWVATTLDGIFRHDPKSGWTKLAQGPRSPHLRPEPVAPGCWLYAAEDEVGWLRRTDGRYVFERFPQPGMGHVYGGIADAKGVFWVELGTPRVARIEATLPRPTVEVLVPPGRVNDSWLQLFQFEGEVRVNTTERVMRYDPAKRRLVTDTDLPQRIPALGGALGRPAADARGRLWITRTEGVVVLNPRSPGAGESLEAVPEGLRPIYFTPERDGVVWMDEPMRLERFDPAMPAPEPAPLRAIITRVDLPAAGRVLYPEKERLPDLPSSSSTVLVHCAAPNQPIGRAVSFEVLLSGSDGGWVSSGSAGSVTFNHLGPGAYEVRVRPRVGLEIGREARLAFTVLAPWYRTQLAYALFGAGSLGILVGVIWLSTFVARREKLRLERLVARRTSELYASNLELERQNEETSQKSAALRASEERFRRLYENAPDIIFRVRVVPEVGYEYISPAVTAITGYRPEEFLADPALCRTIAEPPGAETIYDYACARLVPETVREIQWRARDGRVVTLEERLTPVRDAAGSLVAIEGIIRDVTERKLLEDRLRQAQRIEAVGQLAGGVAHDYNNILTSTLMQLGLLLADPAQTEATRHALRQLVADAERAAGLTRQLLMFSRRQVIQMKQRDLNEVLANLLRMLQRLLGETISLEFHAGPGPLWIKADAGMIEQVVTNLCVNARDAMAPRGGRLTIDARFVELDAAAGRTNTDARAGRFVCLTVTDTGCGMDAATMQHIFEPFFTTKEVGKGTGLGLATVYGVMKQHDGWVDVESEVGKGSVFRAYFPALPDAAVPGPVSAKAEIHQGSETILVVEDEQAVRDMVVRGLQLLGYRVRVAANGDEAMKVWARHAAEIDLLFTDIKMPGGLSGLDLYDRLKRAKPSLKVVLSSGYSEEIMNLGMSVNPILVFLPKPFDVKELAATVRRCLDRE